METVVAEVFRFEVAACGIGFRARTRIDEREEETVIGFVESETYVLPIDGEEELTVALVLPNVTGSGLDRNKFAVIESFGLHGEVKVGIVIVVAEVGEFVLLVAPAGFVL